MGILATFHCPALSFCNYIGWTDWFEGFDFVFLFVFCILVENGRSGQKSFEQERAELRDVKHTMKKA